MKIFFKIEIGNVNFKEIYNSDNKENNIIDQPESYKKNLTTNKHKYLIKFDFAGFLKLEFNINNHNSTKAQKQKSSSKEFIYDTQYANNLDDKFMKIKCQRVKWLFFNRKTTISKYQIDLLSLATGSSKYVIRLANYNLTFNCIMTQLCPQLKHIITIRNLATDRNVFLKCKLIHNNSDNDGSDGSDTSTLVPDTTGDFVNYIHLENQNTFELTLSNKSVLDLESYIFQLEIIDRDKSEALSIYYSKKLMEDYDPKNSNNKYLKMKFHKTKLEKDIIDIYESFEKGPIYRQMSTLSCATEEGVIYGHVLNDRYPLPLKWAKFANLSIKNLGDNSIDDNDKESNSKYIKIVELLHLYFNDKIQKLEYENDKEKFIKKYMEYNKKLKQCIDRVKIRFQIPIGDE
jgi:hypothetical protein